MSRRWFGTDGVRGLADEGPLAPPFLRRLGQALGESAGAGPVLLARDTRESGPRITAALVEGLAAAGVEGVDLGVLPTPGLPMAMRAQGLTRGVVVSASHNPWRDNGVKVFGDGGHKLSDEVELALEARIAALGGTEDDGLPAPAPVPQGDDGAAGYVAALIARFADLDLGGLDLAVDCANGSASLTAVPVLTALGARVSAVACTPDGRNINDGCGSTHLGLLASTVCEGGHALGMAFDGDADRVLMVDGRGRPCTGDAMLGVLGPWLDGRGRLPGRTVVATIMSNLGLEQRLASAGLSMVRTPVGDRYVLAAMREGGFALGGEDSGHLLFGDENDHTGDGLDTGLRVLRALRDTGTTVGDAIDAIPAIPQVLVNVPVAAKPPIEALGDLNARVHALQEQHGGDLRLVLRYSGTESLARVMVEGVDSDVVHATADELAALWAREAQGAAE